MPQNNSNAFHTGCLQFDQHVYITHRDLTQAEQEKRQGVCCIIKDTLTLKSLTYFITFDVFCLVIQKSSVVDEKFLFVNSRTDFLSSINRE